MKRESKPLTGNEPFLQRGVSEDFDVLSFWRWAHSEINGNTERGVLAEFIVGRALGVTTPMRTEWDSYDLLTPEGIKVEVKASGSWQSWGQDKKSLIKFGIAPARSWDKFTGKYADETTRVADVYVFCVLHHDDGKEMDPLNLDQWSFHVVSRATIENKLGAQKSAVISTLTRIGARQVNYGGLKEAVANAIGN